MKITRALRRIWNQFQPTSLVVRRMRQDWNERARTNARYFVAQNQDWSDPEFFASGKTWIDLYVSPDLHLICRGRPASALRMLELGCGAGRMTASFSDIFGTVDAVDVSSNMLAQAMKSLAQRKNITFRLTDGKSLSEFADNTFDFAFSAIVFQHIPRKAIIKNYIKEVARVLREGSIFKFQVSGVPGKQRYADTWEGVGFAEEEMLSICETNGLSVLASHGAATQYFWLTVVKRGALGTEPSFPQSRGQRDETESEKQPTSQEGRSQLYLLACIFPSLINADKDISLGRIRRFRGNPYSGLWHSGSISHYSGDCTGLNGK